mgnify:CR=1 FL=1
MKRIFLILLLSLLAAAAGNGQIEDIKEKSEEQEEKKDKNEDEDKDNKKGKGRTYSCNNGDKDDCTDECATSCAETFFELGFEIVTKTLVEHHTSLMENRDLFPEALSFEVLPQAGFSPEYAGWNITPRIRATWGVFSTDGRYTFMHDSTGNLHLWDWQILQLNLNWNTRFRTRIGTGIFYNKYVGEAFNEHSLVMDIAFTELWHIALEGRIALDYDPEAPVNNVFTEANARTDIRLARTSNMMFFVNAGYLYQRFYESVDINAITLGLRLMFY